MIVVLDTNALHGDVYARGASAEILFTAAAGGGFEVWVPSVVVEELVRQFPERFGVVARAYGKHAYDARSLGLPVPELPDENEAIAAYREQLETILERDGVKVVDPPAGTGVIAEWVAQRREPIPGNGKGTVDAQIWLTALEAAAEGDVVLLSKNPRDFADEDDASELHPVLRQDMEDRGLADDAIEIVESIFEFNQQHIESGELALGEARALLADEARRARLIAEIESSIEWFPLDAESEDWRAALDTDFDDANLVAFDVEALTLLRADGGRKGTYVSLVAYGLATLDVDLSTADAVQLSEASPVSPGSLNLEQPAVSASGAVPARLALEVLLDDGKPFVSVEEVKPVISEEIELLVEEWSKENSGAALDLVSAEFDAAEQRATHVRPRSVERFEFYPDGIYAWVEFAVDYDNPIDDADADFAANNATEFSLRLRISKPDLDALRLGEVDSPIDPYGR